MAFPLIFSLACTDGIKATSSSKRNAATNIATDSTTEKLALLEKQVIELIMTWSGSDADKSKAREYISSANNFTTTLGNDSSLSTNERVQYLQRVSVLKTLVETKLTQNGNVSNTDIEELKKQIYGTAPSSLDKPSQPNRNSAFSTTGIITFSWSAVNEALSYNVKIGTTPGTGNLFSGNVGNVLFKSLEGVASGTTAYAVVQAVNGTVSSEYSDPSQEIYVDTAAPTVPANLILSKTLGGVGVTVSSSSSFYLRWDTPTDSGSGVKDYTVTLYAQANCAGSGTDTTGVVTNSQTVTTGADNTTYSFKIKAYDHAGNYSTSACSSSLTVDLSAPPALLTFSGATGSQNSEINLTIDFPISSDVASVVIRRSAGATAPIDCSSGITVKIFNGFSNTVYTDTTPTGGNAYSYRACVYDAAGNVTDTNTAQNITSMIYVHTIFATAASYQGNIGGISAADNYCQTAGTGASLGGKWRAIISAIGDHAKDRIVIKGVVKNRNNQIIVNSKTELWSGTLQNAVGYNEFGVAVTGAAFTGTNSSGAATSTCANWLSTGGSYNYLGGSVASAAASWIDSVWTSCNQWNRLYCISQPEGFDLTSLTGATGGGSNGDVDITIHFPTDTSVLQTVTIRRLQGTIEPNADCSTNGTLIKTFDTTTGFTDQTFTDTTPNPGYMYSYRACVFDSGGDLMSTSTILKIIAKGPRHILFASSTSYSGVLGGLAGGDSICQTIATNAGLSGTFKALISTNTTSASTRVLINGPVYGVDGALIANNQADLWDGSISSFPKSEFGTNSGVDYFWTGSTASGSSANNTCSGWTGAGTGNVGQLNSTNNNWLANSSPFCTTNTYGLYCLSE